MKNKTNRTKLIVLLVLFTI